VKAQINAAHFSEHMPQFQRLQQNFNEAKAYGNKLEGKSFEWKKVKP